MVEMPAAQEQIVVGMRSGCAPRRALRVEALVSILEAKAVSRTDGDLEASENI